VDGVIFEGGQRTGNRELDVGRQLTAKRIFPALEILHSGATQEEFLLSAEKLDKV
jgi:transcription termination factor Rho